MWCHRAGNRSPLPAIVLTFAAAAIVRADAPQAGAIRIDPYSGFSTTRELAAGGTDRYELTLTAGQFADLVVTGAEGLVASLVDPDGRERVRMPRDITPDGGRRLSDVAERDGVYGVIVAAGGSSATQQYTLRVIDVRAASDADRSRAGAVAAFAEGERSTLLRSGAGYRAAIAPYKRAAALWKASGDRAEEAAALFRLGFAHGSVSQYREAIDAYVASAALRHELGDRRSEGTTLNNVGSQYAELSNYAEAERYYEQALALRREANDRDGEAYTLSGIGTVAQAHGDVERALGIFQQTRALWQAVGNRAGEGIAWNNIGSASRLLGNFQDALDAYTHALAIRREVGNRPGVMQTLTQIGYLRATLGDPQKAIEAFEEALSSRDPQAGGRSVAYALNATGAALAQLQRWDEAFARFDEASAIFTRIGDRDGQARALLSAGQAWLSRGDPARALELAGAAQEIYRALGSRRWLAITDTTIADANARLGKADLAIERYTNAAATAHDVRDRHAEAAALANLAELERRLGRIEEARANAGTAVGLIEALRAEAPGDELRVSYLSAVHSAYELLVDLEMTLDTRHPGNGHLATAMIASERARARGLVDLLSGARLAVAPNAYAALTQPLQLGIAEIQRLLDPDTLLVEYSLGARHSYAWTVTRDTIAGHVLASRDTIDEAARRAHGLLSRGARRETQLQTKRALETLSDLVLAPIGASLQTRRVVVVADGSLLYVPFAALPAPAVPRSASLSGERPQRGSAAAADPLIATRDVVMLPSASALDALRRGARARSAHDRELAVFADPVLNGNDPRVAARSRTIATDAAVQSLARLPFARAEADAIAAFAPPGQTLQALGFEATRDRAFAELGRSRLVHFATHALVNDERPELSGIALSTVDRGGDPIDGFLRLRDVYNLRLNADLVVLSACRTALGKELRGEGFIGLTRGFLYAGAPAVVASLWDVRDRSTAELMTRFYRSMLRDGLPPAAALRAAQASMWRDPLWSAPAHWAGFILQGDWRKP